MSFCQNQEKFLWKSNPIFWESFDAVMKSSWVKAVVLLLLLSGALEEIGTMRQIQLTLCHFKYLAFGFLLFAEN
jgi:hypothetical protein